MFPKAFIFLAISTFAQRKRALLAAPCYVGKHFERKDNLILKIIRIFKEIKQLSCPKHRL